MDEKELNSIPEKDASATVPEPEDIPAPQEKVQEQQSPASSPSLEETEEEWNFDAQVQTDLSKMDFSYSGKEIEIVAPLLKEEPVPSQDVITISKTKVKKTFKIIGMIFAALLGVCVIAAGVVYTFILPNKMELMTPVNTALSIDGTRVSPGSYNYYYNSMTSESYLSNYASAYGLDTTVDFDKQYYDEATGQTWADYFESSTVEELKYMIYYYNCAKDAGLKLSDDEKEQMNTAMAGIDDSAATAGLSTSDYLKETFGEHVGVKTIRKMQEQRYLAQLYIQQLSATERGSAAEVDAYYKEHADDLTVASFRYLPIPYTAANKEEVRTKSEELKGKLTDSATFTETAKPYAEAEYQSYLTDDSTIIADITSTNEQIPGDIREWLFTSGVKVNDTTIVDNTDQSCFYVVMMDQAPLLNEEKLFSVRHLLVKVESETDDSGKATEPTEEQWASCKEKAQGLLDEFNKTDKSEFSFAKLADEKSEDTASTSASGNGTSYGGLLAQSTVGQMVAPFENWCVDAARKYGDVELVKTDYGYHLIYFISNQEAWKYTAENAILGEKQDANVKKVTADKKMGFSKRSIAKPETTDDTTSTSSKK